MVDRTKSVDAVHLQAARQIMLADSVLAGFLSAFACGQLAVGTFADAGEFTARAWFAVPTPVGQTGCDSVRAEPSPLQTAAMQRLETARLQEACRQQWGAFRGALAAALSAPQLERETYSAIYDLVLSLIRSSPRVVLVLSDALDTYTRPLPRLDVPPASQVVFILVPATAAYGGARATHAAGQQWATSARVLAEPYSRLGDPSFWAGLVRQPLAQAPVHN